MSILVLIDYSNIKNQNIPLRKAIEYITDREASSEIKKIQVRLYGGWYENSQATDDRNNAVAELSDTMPGAIINDGKIWQIKTEFADYTAKIKQLDVFPVKNTVLRRKSTSPELVLNSYDECDSPDCGKMEVLKWLKRKRGCTSQLCQKKYAEIFSRVEQKQVDTHLAIDFYRYCVESNKFDSVWLISNDIDMLPSIFSVISNNIDRRINVLITQKVLWIHDQLLEESGVNIWNWEECHA
jgi:uncharacterized LabA/DUF88 family protein